MCGIIGYNGTKKCVPKLISALESLEYRGYDSSGIAIKNNDKIDIIKEKGKIGNLKKLVNMDECATLGIGHTRWATHGEASKTNAHPHKQGNITLVHNGIIENYMELKKELLKKGYTFKSETDSEVACALIDSIYQETKDIITSLHQASNILKGSYALAVLIDNDTNLYGIRKDSPLIVASSASGYYLASDVPAILKFTNKYYLLEDLEIAKLNKDKAIFYNKDLNEITKDLLTFEGSFEQASKGGYEHFMLKEINEQDKVFKDTINYYFDGSKDSLEKNFGFLNKYKNIHIVACGSAYHTGVVGKYLLENYGKIPVTCEVASEYRYKENFYTKDTLVILVSQSGETADTLAALRKAKQDGIDTLAIVNVVGSSIAREADKTIYIKAGFEIAVATTKAYLAQLAIFSLLALSLGLHHQRITNEEYDIILKDINLLPTLIKEVINKTNYLDISNKIFNHQSIFFIGRGIDYALALEGSLKLKEISYINSVAYQAGELKHGTISLIDKDTPVIALVTDKYLEEKTISNIKEVKARGAYVVLVSQNTYEDKFYDDELLVPKVYSIFQGLLTIIPLQLLAYYVAKNKNCNIDKPRNLAKSVTVE